ncbi:MAG: hypothetical protein WC781_05780 [Candidatus Pacearchaeota archaeon]|jgi:putative ribosome biogenesis GTPase RsgA
MNSNNSFNHYKHDICGKFNDISNAISLMDESVFNDQEKNETFHAIHEVLLRMVKTSRMTILDNLKQELVLIISDQTPNLKLSKLQIEGITVRYESLMNITNYYYFESENSGNIDSNTGIICALLPVKKIINIAKLNHINE